MEEASRRKVDLVVISDVHLGTYGSHAKELNHYLQSIEPATIVLNGDIIDVWNFKKNFWPDEHMKTLYILLDYIKNGKTVYYLTGNHDEVLRKFSDFRIKNFHLKDKLVLGVKGETAWFFHGDIFDLTIKHSKWIAKIGGKSYDYLIKWNALVNSLLTALGKEKISMARNIKSSVKKAVKYIHDFEETAAEHAISQKYDYVVCGHIHQPQIRKYRNDDGEVVYLNSGDWVENLTSLEYYNNRWHIYSYHNDPHMSSENENKVIYINTSLQEDANKTVEINHLELKVDKLCKEIIKMQIEDRF